MKDYKDYSASEFAQDDRFQQWVKSQGGNPELDHFWMNWVLTYPEKAKEVEEAKNLILAVVLEENYTLSKERQRALLNRIDQSILKYEPDTLNSSNTKNIFLRIAAVFAFVVLSITTWMYVTRPKDIEAQVYTKGAFVKEINNGERPKTIVLEDGTSIVLQPKSVLQYPETFDRNIREVTLTGEAFFEVAKFPTRPFLVYTNEMVTKVLGTSFIIRAFENEKTFLVQVKTGTVSVFAAQDINANKANGNRLDGMVVTPNQQVTFSREDSRMSKSLVDNPALLNGFVKQKFKYRDTPLPEVFETLKKAYGVDIVYDRDVFSSCLINGSLDDIPLYSKLRVICKGINAHFEIIDSRIVITGDGCQ